MQVVCCWCRAYDANRGCVHCVRDVCRMYVAGAKGVLYVWNLYNVYGMFSVCVRDVCGVFGIYTVCS